MSRAAGGCAARLHLDKDSRMPTVAPLDLDGYCLFAGFLGETPVFALADGTVHRLDNGHQSDQVHDGLTCAVVSLDEKALITGGEDGL
ncbi:MAG: hypothetical protein KAH44_28135, partial [Oricola sp.]|nr:hypothetical protein [Oricola sp.]